MYPNYINDRKALGYAVLEDNRCGIKLVLITDSSVLFIRDLPSNVNHKTQRVILVIVLVFSLCFNNVQPSSTEATDSANRTQRASIERVISNQKLNIVYDSEELEQLEYDREKVTLVKDGWF